ncbi:MAG: VOC family protein [Alphaproteobacteria bacterium]|nr:VOC family protein [Alphaproteobacteria bacterium]
MKHLRVIAASAALALAPGARSLAVESNDPVHPSLSFVRLNVSDMPRIVAFYEKAFGMTEQRRMDNGGNQEVILSTPGGLDLALQHFKDNRKLTLGDAYGEIGFYIQDVDAAYKRAIDAGAVSKVAPGGGGGLRVAIVLDPEGHAIELLRRPPAP